jgi:hypothetical protein
MSQPPSASSGGAAPLSLIQRCIGMLTSPRATFENVVSWPRWFGPFAVTLVLALIVTTWFFWSEVGQAAFVEQARTQNPNMPVEQAQQVAGFMKYVIPIAVPFVSCIFLFGGAGVLMGVFAITGGSASYKQVLAVLAHAGIVSSVAQIFLTVTNYARGSLVSITSLAGLGSAFEEHSFMAGFLGAIDLWWFWYFLVLAIGLGVLYRRRTAPIFVTFTVIYLVIALGNGAVKALTGGS